MCYVLLQGRLQLVMGGLLVQGALFDGRRLNPVTRESPSYSVLPPCYVAWLPRELPHPVTPHINVPLYINTQREKLLAEIQLPLADAASRDMWLLMGLATFVSA